MINNHVWFNRTAEVLENLEVRFPTKHDPTMDNQNNMCVKKTKLTWNHSNLDAGVFKIKQYYQHVVDTVMSCFFLTSMYVAYLIGAAEIPRGRFRTTSHFYLFLGVGKKSQTVHNSGNCRLFLKVPNTYSIFIISCFSSSIEHLIESFIVSSRQDLGVSQKQKTEKKNNHIVICCLNVP